MACTVTRSTSAIPRSSRCCGPSWRSLMTARSGLRCSSITCRCPDSTTATSACGTTDGSRAGPGRSISWQASCRSWRRYRWSASSPSSAAAAVPLTAVRAAGAMSRGKTPRRHLTKGGALAAGPLTTEMHSFPDRRAWRAWLKRNHRACQRVWLVYYKKGSGKPSVSYNDAVEEALCFGWIDSTVRTIDAERYCQQFTPRRDVSNWSDLNRRRLRKLIDAGLMTKAGLAKVHADVLAKPAPAEKPRVKAGEVKVLVPPDLRAALKADPVAKQNFEKFSPSCRRHYVQWILSSKRDETRRRRVATAVQRLAQNRRLYYD